jgi:hypothetical protein
VVENPFAAGMYRKPQQCPIKEGIMASQVILASIIFVVGYVVTGVVLIEIAMWVMRRLDDPAASAIGRCRAVERQVSATLSFQADLGHTYLPEGCMRKTIEADQFGYPRTSESLFLFLEQFEKIAPPNVIDIGHRSLTFSKYGLFSGEKPRGEAR